MMSTNKETKPTDQEIIQKFNFMKQELTSIAQKIGELEQEKEEHQLVIDTLAPLDANRTCYRLVGGVLVQKSIKEVLPAVTQNQQGISTLMNQLGVNYKKKEDEMTEYQKKYNIKIKN
ncbi:Prefoldin [Globomyces pollinis-pini]|nr:Prefoldin [Globomyces pollinis-pini]